MHGGPSPLEPSAAAMSELVRRASEHVIRHLESLPTLAAYDIEGGSELAQSLVEPMPEKGESFGPLLERFFERILPKGYNTSSPGSLSYINGGGLFHAAVADFIAVASNPYVGYWQASPGCVQIEHTVIRWFSDMIGL